MKKIDLMTKDIHALNTMPALKTVTEEYPNPLFPKFLREAIFSSEV